nr:MAG TPA: Sporulation protein Cse60 [Caudoviricetes sp.]
MRKFFKEFQDNCYEGGAVDALNSYIENNPACRIVDVKYNVVHYGQINQDRTYILVEVEE